MGLPSLTASAFSDKWISISPSESAFTSVTSGLTLGSALREVTPTGDITRGKSKRVDGQRSTSIIGTGLTGQEHAVLFIAAGGKRLPVEAVASSGTGKGASGELVAFSRWGERVSAAKPASATPLAVLLAGTPSSG
jgi:hypothetical protein